LVRLLEVATGRELPRLDGRRGCILAPAFSPDGGRLATGGGDATVVTWDVAPFRG
jgi:WD40 repeat protein